MQFTAKTEKQLREELLIPAGTYPYEVLNAEDKKSKAGNDMIELSLRIYLPDGGERQLRDWLMEKMAFRLYHFCAYATPGLIEKYEAGTLTAPDCIGRSGYVVIEIQRDKLGQYPDRNSVRDYVKAPGAAAGMTPAPARPAPAPAAPDAGTDEDVPF